MSLVPITCPHCGFSREVEDSVIPVAGTNVNCPKCRQSFPLQEITHVEEATDQPLPVESAPLRSASQADWKIGQIKPEPVPAQVLDFSFTGNARDYFGIWIVNMLLKIITLGVYTAWAKIRKRRYFYGNTLLNNTVFEYLANPIALFKGWLLAAFFFISYTVGVKVSSVISAILAIIFFLGMPWLIVRSRIFNMRNSAYRNIRFTFYPNYREAYMVFVWLSLLIPFTLGTILPYVIYRQKKFFVENSGYGRNRFSFDAKPKDFYLLFIKATGLGILIVLVLVSCIFVFSSNISHMFGNNVDKKTITMIIGFAAILIFYFIYFLVSIYLQTAIANLTWKRTRIKSSHFSSTLKVRDMAWLYISSGVAILISLGLLIPWASIRITRYLFDNLSLHLKDDIESFLGWGHAETGAFGEEIGDMFGIDIGL